VKDFDFGKFKAPQTQTILENQSSKEEIFETGDVFNNLGSFSKAKAKPQGQASSQKLQSSNSITKQQSTATADRNYKKNILI
jgi:hypothetical protein